MSARDQGDFASCLGLGRVVNCEMGGKFPFNTACHRQQPLSFLQLIARTGSDLQMIGPEQALHQAE